MLTREQREELLDRALVVVACILAIAALSLGGCL